MANDVFGRTASTFGGAFSADAAVCSFSGLAGGGVGLLTQMLQFNYAQRVRRIWEIGSALTFFIVGRSAGSANVQRILGPRPIQTAFYSTYGNACNAANNTLIFSIGLGCSQPGDLGSGDGISFALTGVLLTSVGYSVQAEDMVFGEQLEMMFISLQFP
jgi:hypothetical protein